MGTVTHKLLLIFLLLCFQTQTLAAVVLSCAHGGVAADVTVDACHQPAAAAAQESDSDTPKAPCFDCYKCQLGCAFGVATLPFGRSAVTASDSRPVTGWNSIRHFYCFVPEPSQRPPISTRS